VDVYFPEKRRSYEQGFAGQKNLRIVSNIGPILALGALLSLTVPLGALTSTGQTAGHVQISDVLFALVLLLLAAKLGGELLERWRQPPVLGELIFGMLLGNLTLFGYSGLEAIKSHPGIAFAGEVGVILLLFEVGLESNLHELLDVGKSAALVATLGVVAPMLLGYGVSSLFLEESAWYVHLFVGATLTATSVGITARVLKDIGKMDTREARIILGAAVLDDVLGLIILAVVTALTASIASYGAAEISAIPILTIILKSVGFLAIAVILGRSLAGKVLALGSRFRVRGMPVVLTLCYCFVVAGLAELVGLAPIIGAFAAGLVLDETHYRGYRCMNSIKIGEILSPISSVLVPVFFVLIGLRVDLSSLFSFPTLKFSLFLCIAAVIGKQVCSLGVLEKGLNRFVVGAGMIPRGEVGLIFAGIGASTIVGGQAVFGPDIFSAVILMVMVTTLAAPPLLSTLFRINNPAQE
jgi:Kef-type K+ transport system membrane component KefB